jgi:hypothetical protein
MGDYRPKLVLAFNPVLAEEPKRHPALLRKAQNTAEHNTKKHAPIN